MASGPACGRRGGFMSLSNVYRARKLYGAKPARRRPPTDDRTDSATLLLEQGQREAPPWGGASRHVILGPWSRYAVVVGALAVRLGKTSASGETRRRWTNPRIDRISSIAAPMKATIEASSAIWPIFQNANASSRLPRSIVPLNTASTWPASATFLGCARALADSWA